MMFMRDHFFASDDIVCERRGSNMCVTIPAIFTRCESCGETWCACDLDGPSLQFTIDVGVGA